LFSPRSGSEGPPRAAARHRAEEAARPVVIEFAGTPRAGKTTAIEGLRERFDRDGRGVLVVEEQAQHCPVPDKRNPDFNRWTYAATMQRIVAARYECTDVVLVDRGPFDTLAWNELYPSKNRETYAAALRAEVVELVGLVVVMTVSPEKAMERDGRAARHPAGSIINQWTLRAINRAIDAAVARILPGCGPQLVRIDTTRIDTEAMLDRVTEAVIDFLSGPDPLSRPA
jgi:thymidylate kinase